MKIKTKQYAMALCESLNGKSSAEVKPVIKKFVELLAEKKFLSKSSKVISEFEKIWNKNNGIVEFEAESAGKLDKAAGKSLETYVALASGAEKVVIKEKIDKNILGGVIIRYGDKVLDASLKTQLHELKNKLIK
ncbi:MAG: ATP synthase F1 subunit delta [bacterium]